MNSGHRRHAYLKDKDLVCYLSSEPLGCWYVLFVLALKSGEKPCVFGPCEYHFNADANGQTPRNRR